MSNIALSYSRLNTFDTCPRKFYLQFIEKGFPDDSDNQHFIYGKNIHKQLEDYALYKERAKTCETATPPELNKTAARGKGMVDKVFDSYSEVFIEQQLCIDKEWNTIDWFNTTRSFYRVIYDLAALNRDSGKALLIDWKTGKVRDYDNNKHGQLRLSACILFSIAPEIEDITTSYVFLDHKHSIPVKFGRSELPQMQDDFIKAFEVVNEEENFDPKRNKYCMFCPATRDQCPYAKSKI
jgi:CRISPR/Cas system-associated exonuclease Cas4 (RecB family)